MPLTLELDPTIELNWFAGDAARAFSPMGRLTKRWAGTVLLTAKKTYLKRPVPLQRCFGLWRYWRKHRILSPLTISG